MDSELNDDMVRSRNYESDEHNGELLYPMILDNILDYSYIINSDYYINLILIMLVLLAFEVGFLCVFLQQMLMELIYIVVLFVFIF